MVIMLDMPYITESYDSGSPFEYDSIVMSLICMKHAISSKDGQ